MSKLRLAFMGTPEFAVPALDRLFHAGHDIAAVYCQPPRPAGRGHRPMPSQVQIYAEIAGLPLRVPERLDEAAIAEFAALRLDAAVVAAYGLILPKAILAAPRLGCLNIHASLLPRWRGAAPIQRAILAGDAETGITIMQMDEGLDTGPILMSEATPIGPDATAQELNGRLAHIGAPLVVAALDGVAEGRLEPRPQPVEGVTYAKKVKRSEGALDWRQPAVALERAVRAFHPWPGAWFEHEGERIKVIVAEIAAAPPGAAPGTVLDDRLTIACGEGALRPRAVQRAGRAAQPIDVFLRGFPVPAGTRLSCPATS
jgi:methionyl-tRNA formyltransferase